MSEAERIREAFELTPEALNKVREMVTKICEVNEDGAARVKALRQNAAELFSEEEVMYASYLLATFDMLVLMTGEHILDEDELRAAARR